MNASPTPSTAARTMISTSSTISGPFTATARDCLPLSSSHRYTPAAAVACQVTRAYRLLVRLEVAGRTHDGRPVVLGYAERDHVPFDEFPEMNAGVEARGDEVYAALIGRHIEHDVRVSARKLPQLRCEHGGRGNGRHDQAHAARRPVTQPGNQVHSSPNVAERRAQTRDKLLSGMCRGHAARRSREQAYAKPLFQPPHRVADRRGRHPQTFRRPGKASLLRHGKERG